MLENVNARETTGDKGDNNNFQGKQIKFPKVQMIRTKLNSVGELCGKHLLRRM
jgi:hypothetical protein